jgi:L-asparaginase II
LSNPVLVEVLRGDIVESAHRGAVIACDDSGAALFEAGDISRPVFPRSAVKAIQALPLVESGTADALGFTNRELALACASHSGESAHVELAGSMLSRAGLAETDLECGSHWPTSHEALLALAGSGRRPSALHNNCSGKHAGFLCTCRHLGHPTLSYVEAGHPLQQLVRSVLEEVTGAAHTSANRAVDGCSIPTYAVPLRALALGFARMVTGTGLPAARATAARRLVAACMAEPFYVAGTGRADTRLMSIAPGRLFVKTGAEGVYCAAIPELGLGIALKCDDGAGRAAESMVAAVLAKLFRPDPELRSRLLGEAAPPVVSRRGAEVGRIRPGALFA